jgi:type VI secretion system protein ImpK
MLTINQSKFLASANPRAVIHNHLLIAADPVFILFEETLSQKEAPDISNTRVRLSKAIDQFKEKLSTLGYYHETVLMGAFALSALIDETIEQTPWGRKSSWSQHPLTHDIDSQFHAVTYFFDILKFILSKPEQYIDVIELMHVCLSLGFKGKYKKNSERKQLSKIKEVVYATISSRRNDYSQRLSCIYQKSFPQLRHVKTSAPIFTALLLVTFMVSLVAGEIYYVLSLHQHQLKKQFYYLTQ